MTRRRAAVVLLAVAALAAGSLAAIPAASAAPATGKVRPAAKPIPGSYIVVFANGQMSVTSAKSHAKSLANTYGGAVKRVYSSALKGYVAHMSAAQAAKLAADPSVAYVEQDGVVRADTTQSSPPSWGLDRIDQRNLPLNASYSYDTTASNVTAYIIDTGVRTTHTTFGDRATVGTDTVGDGRNGQDCNGHGTHVAGTVGGAQYGVAKAVRLVAVRVLNCQGSGSNSGVIAGVDWVSSHAVKPAVANMSLGGGASTALDTAVRNSVASGVTYAVAAGNDNTNACNYSPARVAEAITVNATTNTDARASYSNYGTCTDIFAPGSSITSSWSTSDTATNTISGTSMATPHVTGAAALYVSANPTATPAQVAGALTSAATTNVVSNPGTGSPNRLLYTGSTTTPPPPPPPTGCSGQLLGNPGFESGSTSWSATAGVVYSGATNAHSGTWFAWLDGYGSTHTDTLSQTVSIPAGCTATLSYWLRITSSETTTSVAYDRLTVTANGVTVASYSNLNKSGYALRSVNLSNFAGQSVTVKWTGTEDSSLQTSFFVDDTALSLS